MKITSLTFILALLLCIGACKKETAKSSAYDMRDSLSGSYACVTIRYTYTPTASTSDTLRDTVVVAKSLSVDSAILVNGSTFSYSSSYTYYGPNTNLSSCHNFASFDSLGSSIYWADGCQTVSTSSGFISQGSKIH